MDRLRVTSVHGGSSYAPEFIAQAKGYFADEDLEVEIKNHGLGPWAARAVISGDAEIGMGGMWRPLMYRLGISQLRVFAQMCNRCHSNIVARAPSEGFDLSWLADRVVIIPSGAPSQGLFLKGLLRRAGVDVNSVRFIYDFVGAEALELFRNGLGDYLLMTSPIAEQLVAEGAGHLAASLADLGGDVPWSIYYALPSFLEQPDNAAGRFARAIERGRRWARSHDAETEAPDMLRAYFPDVNVEVAGRAFRAVQERNIWSGSVHLPEESQRRWQEMLVEGSVIEAIVPYNEFYDDRAAAWAVSTLSGEESADAAR